MILHLLILIRFSDCLFICVSLITSCRCQVMENQVRDRVKELEELQEAVDKHGGGREDQPELESEILTQRNEFQQLFTPLAQRKSKLEAAKAVHQFYRDLADELVSMCCI